MPVAGQIALSKGEVMMYLSIAVLNRTTAAKLAGVSRATFFRAMRVHRVQAPKPQAKLNPQQVAEIRALLGKRTIKQVAQLYRVHEHTIERLAGFETWRQVS
jgi:predicted DNA-binding transcriptional regulator AlpA